MILNKYLSPHIWELQVNVPFVFKPTSQKKLSPGFFLCIGLAVYNVSVKKLKEFCTIEEAKYITGKVSQWTKEISKPRLFYSQPKHSSNCALLNYVQLLSFCLFLWVTQYHVFLVCFVLFLTEEIILKCLVCMGCIVSANAIFLNCLSWLL